MKRLIACFSFGMMILFPVFSQAQKATKVKVAEDAFVQGGETATEALGATISDRLRIQKSDGNDKYSRSTYLKFAFDAQKDFSSAVLNLCLKVNASKNDVDAQFSLDVYSSENEAWDEASITFEKCPAIQDLMGQTTLAPNENNDWVQIELNAETLKKLIKANQGTVTLVLYNKDFNQTSAEVISKERKWQNGAPAKREAFVELK